MTTTYFVVLFITLTCPSAQKIVRLQIRKMGVRYLINKQISYVKCWNNYSTDVPLLLGIRLTILV